MCSGRPIRGFLSSCDVDLRDYSIEGPLCSPFESLEHEGRASLEPALATGGTLPAHRHDRVRALRRCSIDTGLAPRLAPNALGDARLTESLRGAKGDFGAETESLRGAKGDFGADVGNVEAGTTPGRLSRMDCPHRSFYNLMMVFRVANGSQCVTPASCEGAHHASTSLS
jgi:hypothetical protein